MLRVNEIIRQKGLTKAEVARRARISRNDFYAATNGKMNFFPVWRKRVSEVLGMLENEVFPEFQNN